MDVSSLVLLFRTCFVGTMGARDVSQLPECPHVGIGLAPCLEAPFHPLEVQCCLAKPGNNSLIFTSHRECGEVLQESIEALWQGFIHEFHDAIAERLGVEVASMGPRGLRKPGHNLHVHVVNMWLGANHTHYMAGAVVAMVSLLTGRSVRPDTAAVGEVSYEGDLSPHEDEWEAMTVNLIRSQGIRRIIVGSEVVLRPEAQEIADRLEEDGRVTLEILRFSNILDALPCLLPPSSLLLSDKDLHGSLKCDRLLLFWWCHGGHWLPSRGTPFGESWDSD